MRCDKILSLARAAFEVFGQLIGVLQILSDHLVNIRQSQTPVLLHDLLGSRPPIERPHDKVEGYTSVADSVDPVCILGQRDCVKESRHIQIVAQRPFWSNRRHNLDPGWMPVSAIVMALPTVGTFVGTPSQNRGFS
jgi:hypothetical protein